VTADRPDPGRNGARGVRTDGHYPATAPADPERRLAGRVSRLDRVTLQLGVAVAVVIALCSYAVSATSLYALGVQAGYSWWQAAAVPVVADGPAIYGMFRIVSRSRRGAKGAGYGWLLVTCGTAASIGGNVAHAQPNLVAQLIAAAIPLAVLAMLEGLKGDAGEVTRLAAWAMDLDRAGALTQPDQLPHATTVRRTIPTANPDTAAAALGAQRRALPAGAEPERQHHGRGAAAGRLCPTAAGRPALDRPHPSRGRQLWPQQRRQLPATPTPTSFGAHPMSRPNLGLRDAALGYASRGIPVLPLHYPLPHRGDVQALNGDQQLPSPAVGTGCSCRDPSCGQPGKHPLGALVPHGSRTPPPTGPGCWPGGPATPKPTSAWPPATPLMCWTSTVPPASEPSASWPPPMAWQVRGRWSAPVEAGGISIWPRPAWATSTRRPWSMWTGAAGAAMWSPHPAATATSGSLAGISTPHPARFPRCCSRGCSRGSSSGRRVRTSS
jgi:hypothetical protein